MLQSIILITKSQQLPLNPNGRCLVKIGVLRLKTYSPGVYFIGSFKITDNFHPIFCYSLKNYLEVSFGLTPIRNIFLTFPPPQFLNTQKVSGLNKLAQLPSPPKHIFSVI